MQLTMWVSMATLDAVLTQLQIPAGMAKSLQKNQEDKILASLAPDWSAKLRKSVQITNRIDYEPQTVGAAPLWQSGLARLLGLAPEAIPMAHYFAQGYQDQITGESTRFSNQITECLAFIVPCHYHLGRDFVLLQRLDPTMRWQTDASHLLAATEPLWDGQPPYKVTCRHSSDAVWLWQAPEWVNDWYTHSPEQAYGRPVDQWQPRMADPTNGGRSSVFRWHRLLTEIQMLWHDHPINRARVQDALPPINGLWLWGTGNALKQPVRESIDGIHWLSTSTTPNDWLMQGWVQGFANTHHIPFKYYGSDAMPFSDSTTQNWSGHQLMIVSAQQLQMPKWMEFCQRMIQWNAVKNVTIHWVGQYTRIESQLKSERSDMRRWIRRLLHL